MYGDWENELDDANFQEEYQRPEFSFKTPSGFNRYTDLNLNGLEDIGTDVELDRNISFTSQPSFTSQRSINFSPPNTDDNSPEASFKQNRQTSTAASSLVVNHVLELQAVNNNKQTKTKVVLTSPLASETPSQKRNTSTQKVTNNRIPNKKQEFTYQANTKIGLGFDWDQNCSCFKVTSVGKTGQLQPPVGSLLVYIDDYEVQYLHRQEVQKLLISSRKRQARYTFILPTSPVIDDSRDTKKRKREVKGKMQMDTRSTKEVNRGSKFRCPLCNIQYKRNFILKRHYESQRHLKVLKMTNPTHEFCCVYCLKTFETEAEWKAHKNTDDHISKWSKLHIKNKLQQPSLHAASNSKIKIMDIKSNALEGNQTSKHALYRCKWDTCAFSTLDFKKFCNHVFSHALSCREESLVLAKSVQNDHKKHGIDDKDGRPSRLKNAKEAPDKNKSSSKPSTPLQHARKSEIIGCESSEKSFEKNEEVKIRGKESGKMSGGLVTHNKKKGDEDNAVAYV